MLGRFGFTYYAIGRGKAWSRGILWDEFLATDLTETPPPGPEEIRIIRQELDPQGIFLKSKAG